MDGFIISFNCIIYMQKLLRKYNIRVSHCRNVQRTFLLSQGKKSPDFLGGNYLIVGSTAARFVIIIIIGTQKQSCNFSAVYVTTIFASRSDDILRCFIHYLIFRNLILDTHVT